MKDSEKRSIIILVLWIVLALFNTFVYNFFKSNSIIYIILLALFLGISIFALGFEKDKTLNKVDIIQIVIIYSLLYLIVTYLLGIIFGYTRSPFSLNPLRIIQNVLPVLIVLILEELFRYVILTKSSKKITYTLLVLSFIIFDITLGYKNYDYTSAMGIFTFIGELLIPSIINNLILTYMTKNVGYMPSVIYSMIFNLYVYMVPVYPDFGVYINALLSIIFPTILFTKLNTCLYKREFKQYRGKKLASILVSIPALTLLCVVIALISGLFKYYAIAIGSGSMTPNVNKGDVVIGEKLKTEDFNNLAVNDIIIYQHDNKLIVHRIIKITKNGTTLTFNTKGDHNESADAWNISTSDIRGKVVFKVDYIGYPSVWLSENLNKK